MENEYEQQWSEGETPGPVTDAVLKAERQKRSEKMDEQDGEFAKSFDEVEEAKPAPRFNLQDKADK